MGLEGHWPNEIDPDIIPPALERIRASKRLRLGGQHEIAFDEKRDLVMNKRQKLPFHTNGMRFTAFDADGVELATRDYYSVGGGFVVNQDEAAEDRIVADTTPLPHPFNSGAELLAAMRTQRPEHRPDDVRERKGLAQRGRDPRRPARDSGRRCRAAWRAACAPAAPCRAACTWCGARRPCTRSWRRGRKRRCATR